MSGRSRDRAKVKACGAGCHPGQNLNLASFNDFILSSQTISYSLFSFCLILPTMSWPLGAWQGSWVSEALESPELCQVACLDEGQRVHQVLPQAWVEQCHRVFQEHSRGSQWDRWWTVQSCTIVTFSYPWLALWTFSGHFCVKLSFH